MREDLIDKNPILKLSFDFSLMIIEYTEHLKQLRSFQLAKLLFV